MAAVPPNARSRRPGRGGLAWAIPLVVAAAAIVPYLPALSYQFLNWDDNTYVLANPWIRGWSSENLIHIFTKPYFSNFLPLHLISYAVDYSLWGLNPLGYHLQSILLHALNAVLVLVVVRRMFGSAAMAFLAALLFAVHPSHVEAVAWISIRKDLLATTFALLTVYLYIQSAGAAKIQWGPYVLSVASFSLGLLSKVTIATLPLFLLLLDRVPTPRRSWRLDLASKAPYFLIGLWLVRFNALAQTTAKASYAHDPLTFAVVKGHAMWSYLALLFGTSRGSPDYDLPLWGGDVPTALASIAGLLILPAGIWIAYHLRARASLLGLGWIWITLLPALVFPLVTYMADRYLYLPSVGFCWLLAGGIVALASRAPIPRRRTAALVGIALIPLAGFLARTVQAVPVWRDSETLWTYALTRCHDFRAYANLADVRLGQKRWVEAERLLQISARVPNVVTYQNLGVLYFEQGRYREAALAIERALEILRQQGWDSAQASVLYYSLGAVYWRLGQPGKTVEVLESALRENPSNTAAREQIEIARKAAAAP
jgi:protein O-mannosyl-transferase